MEEAPKRDLPSRSERRVRPLRPLALSPLRPASRPAAGPSDPISKVCGRDPAAPTCGVTGAGTGTTGTTGRWAPFRHQLVGQGKPKKLLNRGNSFITGSLSRCLGGLDAQAGDRTLLHVLQEVAIVGGQLHNHALRSQSKPAGGLCDEPLGMGTPTG